MLYLPDPFDCGYSLNMLWSELWLLSITNRWSQESLTIMLEGWQEAFQESKAR